VYNESEWLLSWYDAFADPIYLGTAVDEMRVFAFAEAIGATATRRAG
jgi:hypothetical protein